jgi:hypothetical protein
MDNTEADYRVQMREAWREIEQGLRHRLETWASTEAPRPPVLRLIASEESTS